MNKFFGIFLGIVFVILLYFLAPILTPFLIGMLLAYLVNPVVNLLMRLRLPRVLAVGVVFLVIFFTMVLLVLLVVPLIQMQLDNLLDAMPVFIAWIQESVMPMLKEHLGITSAISVDSFKTELSQNWAKAGGAAGWLFSTILHSGFTVLHWLVNIMLIFVVTFYLLYDWQKVVDGLHNLLPRKYEPTIVKLVTDCNEVLGAFFRGQLLVMLTLGIFYATGLTLLGLKVGIIVGVMVGLLSLIPYLGVVVGIVAASIAAFVQFGTLVSIVPVLLLFGIGQTLDGMYITPKLVGDRIGLHPVAVIFAVLAGGVLFGFFGVLLALPVASIIMVLLRFINLRYRSSKLYQ